MESTEQQQTGKKAKFKWLKRFGLGAVIFFTVKGLIWLAVFFGLWKVVSCA